MTDIPNFACGERVSVVVAGSAVVSGANIAALLENWLRLRSDNPVKEARFYLPCTSETLTSAVRETAMAIVDWEISSAYYNVVVDGTARKPADRRIERNAVAIIDTLPNELAHALIGELLGDADDTGDGDLPAFTPYVILAWGPQDDAPDDLAGELLDLGEANDITVLEIAARGLDTISSQPLDEAENSAEQKVDENPDVTEPEAGEPNEALREDARRNTDLITRPKDTPPDEAQTVQELVTRLRIADSGVEPMPLKEYLAHVITLLAGMDRVRAALAIGPVEEAPLLTESRRQLLRALREDDSLPKSVAELDEGIPPKKSADPVQANVEPSEATSAMHGRSRTPAGKVSVFRDHTGKIVALAKRGPTPSGRTRDSVPREEVPPELLSA
nr:MAG: hypothetical protein DIU80_23960 [Chloroflexota bacterium]